MVKKNDDTIIRFDRIHERDRHTDRHHMTAKAALAYRRAANMTKKTIRKQVVVRLFGRVAVCSNKLQFV